MLVQEVSPSLVLLIVQTDHELDMGNSLTLGLSQRLDVRRPSLVESLPCTEVNTHRAANQHVGPLFPDDSARSVSLRGLAEVPWLPVSWIADREIEGESRQDVPESLLAPPQLRRDARW